MGPFISQTIPCLSLIGSASTAVHFPQTSIMSRPLKSASVASRGYPWMIWYLQGWRAILASTSSMSSKSSLATRAGHDERERPHVHTSASDPPVLALAVPWLVARHRYYERSGRGLPGGGGATARRDGGDGPAARAGASTRVDDRPERAVPPPYRSDRHDCVLWTHRC